MNYVFDKEKLKNLINLHSQAEEKIKSAESIDQRLSISSVNELRLASKSLIDLLSSVSKEQQNKALDEAIQSCQRVIINVLQAEIIRYIGEIQIFNSEYQEIFDDLPGFDQIEFNKMIRITEIADSFVKKILNDSFDSWEFYNKLLESRNEMRKISDHLLDFVPTAKKRKLKKINSSSKEKIKIAFEAFSKFGGLLTFIIAVLAFVFQFNFCENPLNKNPIIKDIVDGGK